jgi:glycosyltransferase involved in cell wall biosynthesis
MTPELSVVVASVNGLPYIGECLDSLAGARPAVEVIVADSTDEQTRVRLREGWPWVTLLTFDEQQTIPELRAAGVFASAAPYVALIEDHCLVPNQWVRRVVADHQAGHPVVGGPVRNVVTKRLRDWAAFFCEYSEHMEPVPSGDVPTLTGVNVSYDRAAIAAIEDLLLEGRWETYLHPRLVESGFHLFSDPELVIEHAKDFGFREFASQRWHYSRSYAGMRNADLGSKRALYALGSPLLVPLVSSRIVRNVWRRRQHRRELLLAVPLVVVYVTIWAAGEAFGYVFGGGRSLLKVR